MSTNNYNGFLNPSEPISKNAFLKRYFFISSIIFPLVIFGLLSWCKLESYKAYFCFSLCIFLTLILTIQLFKRARDLNIPAWQIFVPLLNLKLFFQKGNGGFGLTNNHSIADSVSNVPHNLSQNKSNNSFDGVVMLWFILFLISLFLSAFYISENYEKFDCFQNLEDGKKEAQIIKSEKFSTDEKFETLAYKGKYYSVFSFNDLEETRENLKVVQNFQKETHNNYLIQNDKFNYFLANAGFVETGCMPTGYLLSQGELVNPLNLKIGIGNFYLKPNGVFYVSTNNINIVDSEDFANLNEQMLNGVQSGPLLLKNNFLNPQIQANSPNLKNRLAVGIRKSSYPSRVLFVKSEQAVTFYELAQFFKNVLDCSYALHLMSEGIVMHHPENNNKPAKDIVICSYLQYKLK